MSEQAKKVWVTPTVVRYGSVEEITRDDTQNKDYGDSDGFEFQGESITDVS